VCQRPVEKVAIGGGNGRRGVGNQRCGGEEFAQSGAVEQRRRQKEIEPDDEIRATIGQCLVSLFDRRHCGQETRCCRRRFVRNPRYGLRQNDDFIDERGWAGRDGAEKALDPPGNGRRRRQSCQLGRQREPFSDDRGHIHLPACRYELDVRDQCALDRSFTVRGVRAGRWL